jgi:hypothetical protein
MLQKIRDYLLPAAAELAAYEPLEGVRTIPAATTYWA